MKVTLIGSEKSPHWKSCRSIVNNLFAAYHSRLGRSARTLLFDQGVMQYFHNEKEAYIHAFASDILSTSPDRVVFVGDFPLAPIILRKLVEIGGSRLDRITFTVHVFGDFPLRVGEWFHAEKVLKGLKIRFLCASERQGKFIGQLLKVPEVEVSPFPIDNKLYRFDPLVRKNARKKMGISNRQKVYVYSGRMSLLKNIGTLIALFSELGRREPTSQFVLAGGFDDLISPIFRSKMPEGQYFQMIQEAWSRLPSDVRDRVRFLGDLTPETIVELLNASDVFMSLSLYHDEDYGMAPAEAIGCGLPAVLSDWGGYTSFKEYSKHVQLVTPSLMKEGFFFKHDHTIEILENVKVLNDNQRLQASLESGALLSAPCVGRRLVKILESNKVQKYKGLADRAGILLGSVCDDKQQLKLGSNEYRWVYDAYYKPLIHSEISPGKELR